MTGRTGPHRQPPPRYAGNWHERAACHGIPTEEFFPATTRVPSAAQFKVPTEIARVCFTCPVRVPCLTWALRNHEHGIWGGTTQAQREQILKSRIRLTCLGCGSRVIVSYGRVAVCLACGLSWKQPQTSPEAAGRTSKPEANATDSPQ